MTVQNSTSKGDRSDVHIIESKGRFLVRPSVVVPAHNKKLRISNLTNYPATVTILPGLTLDAGQTASVSIAAQSYDDIKFGANPERTYGYRVTVNVNGVDLQAHGESDPVIIIDPPAN